MQRKRGACSLILILGLFLSSSCELLEREKVFAINKVVFKQGDMFTYQYSVWIEDTSGNMEQLVEEQYKVTVLSINATLPEGKTPLIQLKTQKAKEDKSHASNSYSLDWYRQTNEQLEHVAYFNKAATPAINLKANWSNQNFMFDSLSKPLSNNEQLIDETRQLKDTVYYEEPRLVARWPINAGQESYIVDYGSFSFKKTIDGIEYVETPHEVFKCFKIINTQLGTSFTQNAYVDYLSKTGLIKRINESTIYIKNREAPVKVRTEVKLIHLITTR